MDDRLKSQATHASGCRVYVLSSGFTNRGGFDSSVFSRDFVFLVQEKKVSERLCSGMFESIQGFAAMTSCRRTRGS